MDGGPGPGADLQPAASAPLQRGGGEVEPDEPALVGASHGGRRGGVARARGRDGPPPARGLPLPPRQQPAGGVPAAAAQREAVRRGLGAGELGHTAGAGVPGGARGAPPGQLGRADQAVPPRVLRGADARGAGGAGELRPAGVRVARHGGGGATSSVSSDFIFFWIFIIRIYFIK